MKSLIFLFTGFLFAGCSDAPQQHTSIHELAMVHVVADVTDAPLLQLWPEAVPILQLYNCPQYPERACSFTLSVISNMKTNPSYTAYLPTVQESEKVNSTDDVQWRKKQIRMFYDSVTHIITDFHTIYRNSKSLTYSECWATICHNLETLAKKEAQQKVLVIYSDLKEVNSETNAYKYNKRTNSEKIQQELEHQFSVPKQLSGITVLFIYQPINREDDTRFTQMFFVYKKMLEAQGALVIQQATGEHLLTHAQ